MCNVPCRQAFPPSLNNIYKELLTDIPGFKKPTHGNLAKWAEQGVLLLNTGLTVKAHEAASHKDAGWHHFTDAIINVVSKSGETAETASQFILFRDLYDLLEKAGKREAHVDYTPATTPRKMEGEPQGVGAWLTTLIPVSVSERMAAKSVTRFSERIGHSLEYKINWA